MAEGIAEAACDHAPDFPRFGGADFKAHVTERLAPLYAELERLRAENAELKQRSALPDVPV